MDYETLRTVSYQCILDLATDEGINASGRDEIYGCIFGRDSAITILKILNVVGRNASIDSNHLLQMCRRALLTLVSLQGREINIESGEEPGKFIHEFRRERYDHLLALPKPWYVYPDKTLRNYDSLDATPLALIAIARYYERSGDEEFLQAVMPAVRRGLSWIIAGGDRDNDRLVEYELPATRRYGGLMVQSWTDSGESLMRSDGSFPSYPIAPVEVQGYVWLALNIWADYFEQKRNILFSSVLQRHARLLKRKFNRQVLFFDNGYVFAAQALDGSKNQIRTITGNPLLLLWASREKDGKIESILERKYVKEIVKRAFLPDMFDPDAGVRTMSALSATFDPSPQSYHNGSYWPKLNGMAHEGLLKWKFTNEAAYLREATLKPMAYFGSPIELYIRKDGGYSEFQGPNGQVGCRNQAWSAAAALDMLTR